MQRLIGWSSLKQDCGLTTRLIVMCMGLHWQLDISLRFALLPCCSLILRFIRQRHCCWLALRCDDSLGWVRIRCEKALVRRSLGSIFHTSTSGTGVLSHCTAFWNQKQTQSKQLDQTMSSCVIWHSLLRNLLGHLLPCMILRFLSYILGSIPAWRFQQFAVNQSFFLSRKRLL